MRKRYWMIILVAVLTIVSLTNVSLEPIDATSSGPKYTRISQLNGKTLGCISGSTVPTLVAKRLKGIDWKYYNTMSDLLIALRQHKIEAIVGDEPLLCYYSAREDDLYHIKKEILPDHNGIALPKNSQYTARLNKILKEYRKNGLLKQLKDKWITGDDAHRKLPKLKNSGKNGTWKVGIAPTLEPMNYIADEQPAGLEIELIERIAAKLQVKISFYEMDFNGIIPALQSGKIDMALATVSITKERKKAIDFSVPYYDGGIGCMVLKNVQAVHKDAISSLSDSFYNTFIKENRWKEIVAGLKTTVIISLFSMIFGTLIGIGICLESMKENHVIKRILKGLVSIIKGMPIVVLLMILYYVIFGQFDMPAIIVAIIGFSVNFGVYVSSMMLSGIEAVDKGQQEAALAIGMTKKMTFWKIVFPQAMVHFMPSYEGELISMIKSTSVVGYIAIVDLTKASDIIRARTMEALFPLLVTAIIYFVIANIMIWLLEKLQHQIDPKNNQRLLKGVRRK